MTGLALASGALRPFRVRINAPDAALGRATAQAPLNERKPS